MPRCAPHLVASLVFALALLAAVAGCATGAPPPADGPAGDPDPAFAAALDRAVAGEWGYLRIDAGCRDEALGWHSTVLYGSGVGIVDEARQFSVDRERLRALLARFREVGFASLPATLGGVKKVDPEEVPTTAIQEPDGGGAKVLQAICSLGLRIDGEARRVQQLDRGERHAPMLALCEEILVLGAARGADGVGATSLDEGLRKLVAGELAAEALALTVNHRDAAGDGWLLTVDGGHAFVHPVTAGGGHGARRALGLDAAALGALATALLDARFGELPGNLYAEGYLDYRVELLGHEHAVLAQPFVGMTAETHGAAQRRLESAAAAAASLAERVLDAA